MAESAEALFLDDPKPTHGVSDKPSFIHDFVLAISAVGIILIFSFAIVACLNRQYRRDFEQDYNKAEQLFERCLTQDDLRDKYIKHKDTDDRLTEDDIALMIK